jgi:hypothetical protein
VEEILMAEESDEELGEQNKLIQLQAQYYSLSSDEYEHDDPTEEPELAFRARRARDAPEIFDFTRPPNGLNQ